MRFHGAGRASTALAAALLVAGCASSGGGGDTVEPWACEAGSAQPLPLDPWQQAQALGKGVNLGNELEADPNEGAWSDGVRIEESHFALAREAGFDSVRLPVGLSLHSGVIAPYTIDASFLRRVDQVVRWGVSHGLRVVVDLHNYPGVMASPSGQRSRFIALWKQVAVHFKCAPDTVYYELLNEPNGGLDTAAWNGLVADTIAAIRAIDARHTIVVGATSWSDESGLSGLEIPAAETNAIVTFHYYRPNLFCMQGQAWAGPELATTGIVWPGPPRTPVTPAPGVSDWVKQWIDQYDTVQGDANPASSWRVEQDIALAARWGQENQRPLWMSEFTAQDGADLDSRARWISKVRSELEGNGIPWSFWSLASDPATKLYDVKTSKWNLELTEALGLDVGH